MILSVRQLWFSFGKHWVVSDVSFDVQRGEWLTVVGPNGAGKTTLLRCLLGLLRPTHGEIRIDSRLSASMTRREIARCMALLPQQSEMPIGFSVQEIVAMGRNPHLGRLQPMRDKDHVVVERALHDTETIHLAERPVTQLSGGESQRVFLARAFAQDTPILILDEPTTNLDLFHERTLLNQVKHRRQQGASVVAVLHDLNLAARFSDRILVLDSGRLVALGEPDSTLTAELIENVFRVKATILKDPESQQIRILA